MLSTEDTRVYKNRQVESIQMEMSDQTYGKNMKAVTVIISRTIRQQQLEVKVL